MKKWFIFAVMIFLFPVFVNAQSSKTLVVYYSRDGHTQQVAEALAGKFNADTERLIDKKDRVGPVALTIARKDAIAKNLTEIEEI